MPPITGSPRWPTKTSRLIASRLLSGCDVKGHSGPAKWIRGVEPFGAAVWETGGSKGLQGWAIYWTRKGQRAPMFTFWEQGCSISHWVSPSTLEIVQ